MKSSGKLDIQSYLGRPLIANPCFKAKAKDAYGMNARMIMITLWNDRFVKSRFLDFSLEELDNICNKCVIRKSRVPQ